MAAPTYSDIYAYSTQVQGISQEARAAFLKLAGEIDYSDWAAAAERLREIIYELVDVYGLAAGELGAQWYEYCRAMKYGTGYTAIVGEVSRYSVRSDVDNVIDKLFAEEITIEEMLARLAGVVTDQTQKQARDTVLGNLTAEYLAAKRRGDNAYADSLGYARVPNAGACAFCIMLASRGFVYASYDTAKFKKGGGKYHEDCKCEAVPFHDAKTIKGYGADLKKYTTMYDDAYNMLRGGNMPEDLKLRIAAAKADHEQKIKKGLASDRWSTDNEITIVMRYMNPGLH